MSLNIKGKSCPVCHAYLFEEDDVVFCPICGAPHHRECYSKLGHCGLEQFHGTDEEYSDKPVTQELKEEIKEEQETENAAGENEDAPVICPKCMRQIEKDALVCPYCGTPKNPNIRIIPFDIYGGVAKTDEIAEGVTAEAAAPFVAVNTQRYLPKFKALSKTKKVSWNWIAFLLPEGWFFLRKMYKQGIAVIAGLIAAQVLSFPLLQVMSEVKTNENSVIFRHLLARLPQMGKLPVILFVISIAASLAIKIISALFGDYIYKSHVVEGVKAANEAEDKGEFIMRRGGVNFLLFLLGVILSSNLPGLIFSLFV